MTLSAAQEPAGRAPHLEVPVEGGRLAVWERGEGPPLLFVHGISANHTEWDAVAERLAPRFRVILVDLLGRGASRPAGEADFGLDAEARRLDALLDALDVHRPLAAGHSHGASLVLALAVRRQLGGLLLVNPVTPWTARPAALDLLAVGPLRRAAAPLLRACRRPLTRYILTRRVYGSDAPHIGDAVRRYAAPYADADRSLALLGALRDWRPAELADLSPPPGTDVRIVTGAADRRISPADVRRWADRLGAPCVIVPGAGHGLPEERPERVAGCVRAIANQAARGINQGK